MEKLKKVILVLGPIALIAGVWWTIASNKPPIPDSVKFVNVITGERVTISRSRITDIPMKSDDGKPALYPIYEASPGKYKIDEHFAGTLGAAIRSKQLDSASLKIDPRSLEVP